MGRPDQDGWCILRTSGARTLALAASLGAAGFEAWTPTETVTKRLPRKRAPVSRTGPIMPSFVFVRARHLPALAHILALPRSPHPQFSIFRHYGRYPILGEADISNLRAAEDKARVAVLKTTRHVFPVGEKVRVNEGAGQGMSGVIEGGDGKFALVAFGGGFKMKIATFLLEEDVLGGPQPVEGIAA